MDPALALKTVLGQYNRQLDYFRETAQKVVAAILAYAGLHAGSAAVALSEKTYAALFLAVHGTLLGFVIVIGTANFLRLASSHRALVALLGADVDAELGRLGVFRHEPALVALAWGSLYAVVHGGFVVIVHLLKWH